LQPSLLWLLRLAPQELSPRRSQFRRHCQNLFNQNIKPAG
jgi:hypothetical protein